MSTTTPPVLPRLPVPPLRKTLDRYLASLEPFMLEDAARNGTSYESVYALRAQWADEFASGIGKICQDRLLALDRASPNNWLEDNFWTKKAYLEWRGPLLINSNWWLAFEDDARIPVKEADRPNDGYFQSGCSRWQVRRAAWILHRVLEFKEKLETQEIHPDTTRTGIWLRESTSKMFNVSRIPKPNCDILSIPSPSHPASSSVVVMIHGWFYTLHVSGLSVDSIARGLEGIIHDADSRIRSGAKAVPVGVLSSDDRDNWASNLSHLVSLSPQNQKTLDFISQSLLVLSLDAQPNTLTIDGQLHAIRSTSANVGNRWYDKAYTLIVDSAARAGAMGEHSPCDALVPSIVAEYGLVEGIDSSQFSDTQHPLGDYSRLEWETDTLIEEQCATAQTRANAIIANSDDNVLWFSDYGADWIKGVAKQSADAYIQMALQVAWYKTRGEFTATYETALTRMFNKGRTETIRTLSTNSRAFVRAMVDPDISPETKFNLLRRAIQTHSSLTREAATGRGIDRHLMGLRLMLEPGERADLFDDELFERSSRWKLSTSGLSAGLLFRGTGFGAGYEDGYGINYLAGPDCIKFGIESKFSSPLTSTQAFQNTLVAVLRDMYSICCLPEMGQTHIQSCL
ncbi:acyltransferase ChoActase/COT/CPT [Hymenopellis radicata]|nr:acyltransferase ChoActase/COT/CPT [Hymenopellis radicata]